MEATGGKHMLQFRFSSKYFLLLKVNLRTVGQGPGASEEAFVSVIQWVSKQINEVPLPLVLSIVYR